MNVFMIMRLCTMIWGTAVMVGRIEKEQQKEEQRIEIEEMLSEYLEQQEEEIDEDQEINE